MDLSIIIPTLNEAKYIAKALTCLFANLSTQHEVEVILIDSGSTDSTIKAAEDFDIAVYEKADFKGRKYKSLNYGASKATGKYLMFLDADCLVSENFDKSLIEILKNESVVGGAFEFEMDGKGFLYRNIELLNRVRYRITKRYYGDQGIFCNKIVFDELNGFPEKSLMEAAYFCDMLSKKGELRLSHSKIISSVRRFEKGNVLNVMTKDTLIWLQFLMGMDISKYASLYWKENEDRGK